MSKLRAKDFKCRTFLSMNINDRYAYRELTNKQPLNKPKQIK